MNYKILIINISDIYKNYLLCTSPSPKVDHSLAIKEYSRPAAGKEEANPSDLRPPHVLLKVVNHIVKK